MRKCAVFAWPLWMMPLPAAAATLTTGAAPEVPWLRLIFAFLLCLALAAGAITLLRLYQRRGLSTSLPNLFGQARAIPQKRLRIIETRRASQHGDLCLVEFDGETILLAFTPNGVTVLSRPAPTDETPPGREGQ